MFAGFPHVDVEAFSLRGFPPLPTLTPLPLRPLLLDMGLASLALRGLGIGVVAGVLCGMGSPNPKRPGSVFKVYRSFLGREHLVSCIKYLIPRFRIFSVNVLHEDQRFNM